MSVQRFVSKYEGEEIVYLVGYREEIKNEFERLCELKDNLFRPLYPDNEIDDGFQTAALEIDEAGYIRIMSIDEMMLIILNTLGENKEEEQCAS